jgi:hypothetical protein
MSRSPILAVIALVPAVAAAGPKPIHELAVTNARDTVRIGGTTAEVFRVTGPTPILHAQLTIALTWAASLYNTASNTMTVDISCSPGLMTDVFASWACQGIQYGAGGGGTAPAITADAYEIIGDDLSAVTAKTLFGADFKTKGAALGGMDGDSPCTIDPAGQILVDAEGVTFFGEERGCTASWDVLAPMLVKGSVLRRLVGPNAETPEPAPDNPRAAWAKARPRFAPEAGGILDRATDLVWATADNGVDLDHAAAVKFAAAYRGGGFADWRLPTEDELESVSDRSAAHRDKADCTKGKTALLLTSQIKLTCGLAWSSTAAGKGFVGFGFISGTPRVSKAIEKKNYRALVVRKK